MYHTHSYMLRLLELISEFSHFCHVLHTKFVLYKHFVEKENTSGFVFSSMYSRCDL